MASPNPADVIHSLNAEQQQSVFQFIEFLQRKGTPQPPSFLAAAEEFMAEHPELLRDAKFNAGQQRSHAQYGGAFQKLSQ